MFPLNIRRVGRWSVGTGCSPGSSPGRSVVGVPGARRATFFPPGRPRGSCHALACPRPITLPPKSRPAYPARPPNPPAPNYTLPRGSRGSLPLRALTEALRGRRNHPSWHSLHTHRLPFSFRPERNGSLALTPPPDSHL